MKAFLIILAVLVLITLVILSLSVDLTLIYDKGWTTKVRIVFIEKDVELSKVLSFLLFPDKVAKEVAEEKSNEKKQKKEQEQKTVEVQEETVKDEPSKEDEKPAKQNYIQKLIDTDGIVGLMLLISNLLQTVNSAVTTLFKGLHIYSLYVKMIIGGSDAAEIADDYGTICGIFYPIKGVILNGMRVDNYDDCIQADFIAPSSEYELQLIASINVRLVLRMVLKAGFVFLKNFIKNK